MKKLLALLLSVVMLLSVLPMAGAASFADSAEVTNFNTEAVDVMSDLKIIAGFPEGDFQPNETLTRAQAAKILCCIVLGTKAAEELAPAGPTFSDVPAWHWANKYIEFCASRDIVAGEGDGEFDPNGTLSGTAFGKMLLVAIGENGEDFTGDNWEDAVKEKVHEKHLDYGVAVSEEGITRQDAAHLALNAMFCGERIDPADTLAYKAFKVTRTSAGNNPDRYNRPYIKYYSMDSDAYWAGNAKIINASPVFTQKTAAIKGGDLVEALGETEINGDRIIQFINGAKQKKLATTNLKEGSTKTFSNTVNGVETEVYYLADADMFTIVQRYQFAAKISAVTPAVLNEDGSVATPGKVFFENGWSCESNEFTEEDIGSYACIYGFAPTTASRPDHAVEAYKGKIVSGKLAKYDVKKGATIGKKTYKYSSRYGAGANAKTYLEDGGAVGDEVNILLSNDNFIMAIWKQPAAAAAPAEK